jgi:hypothetical protein
LYGALLIFDICVFVPLLFRFLFVTMVNFGDDCSTVLVFFVPGNDVNDVFFIMENGRLALKQRERSLFVIFGTSVMILQY